MDGEGTMVPCVIVDGERSCVYVLPLYRVSYPLESQDNLPSNLNRLGIETVRSREASCLEKRSFFQRASIHPYHEYRSFVGTPCELQSVQTVFRKSKND